MFRLGLRFLRGDLKAGEGPGPHLVEVGTEAGDTLGVELVETAGSGSAVEHKAGIFEHFEVLGDGGPADGEGAGELIDGQRSAGELLKDGHAGSIPEGVETGLKVSIHHW